MKPRISIIWLPILSVLVSCTTIDSDRLLQDTHRMYAAATTDTAIAGMTIDQIASLEADEPLIIVYREDPAIRTVTVSEAQFVRLTVPQEVDSVSQRRRDQIMTFDPILPSQSLWHAIDTATLAAHREWAGSLVLSSDDGERKWEVPLAHVESVVRVDSAVAYREYDGSKTIGSLIVIGLVGFIVIIFLAILVPPPRLFGPVL